MEVGVNMMCAMRKDKKLINYNASPYNLMMVCLNKFKYLIDHKLIWKYIAI